MNDSIYLHGLNLFVQFGPKRLYKIANFFPSFKDSFLATADDLVSAGIEEATAKEFVKFRQLIDLNQEQANLDKYGIGLVSFKDINFPKLLLEIANPPALLYVRGATLQKDELCIAVVGTRKITTYGRTVTPLLVEPIVAAGVTIVSGLAFGVDTLAQEIAYSRTRRTIAILGGGLDDASLYPQHHVLAAQRVMDGGGCLVSEYPPGTASLKFHFIARNRLIAGLAVATIVVECDLKSGSLITAKYALDENRAVYAVPGPIYSPQSQGPNNLIKMGAKPITSATDVLEDLNLKTLPEQFAVQNLVADSPEEENLLKLLGFEPKTIDEIIKSSGLPAAKVSSALTFLEMKGKIKNLGAQQYILSR